MNTQAKEDFYNNVCSNLKDMLKEFHISYKQIAPKIHLSESVFCNKITNNGGRFTLYEITLIAKELLVSVDDIINE